MAFFINFFNSTNGFKFNMHVSDADSNKFCKFHEIFRNFEIV